MEIPDKGTLDGAHATLLGATSRKGQPPTNFPAEILHVFGVERHQHMIASAVLPGMLFAVGAESKVTFELCVGRHKSARCTSRRRSTPSETFLGAVGVQGTRPNDPWSVSLQLNGNLVEFQIDTGAEVTVISKHGFEKIGSPHMLPADRTLRGPSRRALPVKGRFSGRLGCNGREVVQVVYVVDRLHKPLLGRPAIEELGLVARIQAVSGNPLEDFPDLFQGLGKLEGEYDIKLQDGAKPFAITCPRRVAIPQMGKVKEELERMEQLIGAPAWWSYLRRMMP